ncbi:hypothetical protein BGZ65_010985 [Modicella reniformis]|uniref:Uncharacterized protein n=1 Tax=Modicella reniformis TaxID=1440133 RepID=A0A9P6SNQ6_9FUNG|nr:hypothetical protein BGZ65_010985 [Modicella reniformis]
MVRPLKLNAVYKRPRKACGRPTNDAVSAQASEAYRKRRGPHRPGEISYYLANSGTSVAAASGSGVGACVSETSDDQEVEGEIPSSPQAVESALSVLLARIILSDTDSEDTPCGQAVDAETSSLPGSEEPVRDDSDSFGREIEALLIEAGAVPAPLLVTAYSSLTSPSGSGSSGEASGSASDALQVVVYQPGAVGGAEAGDGEGDGDGDAPGIGGDDATDSDDGDDDDDNDSLSSGEGTGEDAVLEPLPELSERQRIVARSEGVLNQMVLGYQRLVLGQLQRENAAFEAHELVVVPGVFRAEQQKIKSGINRMSNLDDEEEGLAVPRGERKKRRTAFYEAV